MASPDWLCLPTPVPPVLPHKDSSSFWTICTFCHYAYEYLKNYENLDLWCQTCRRPFRAIPMAALPPIIPGTGSYYYWSFGPYSQSPGYRYGGYATRGAAPDLNQNLGFAYRPFFSHPFPNLSLPEAPTDAQKSLPTEQQGAASDPYRQPQTPLPVSGMNRDPSRALASGGNLRSGGSKLSNKNSSHGVKIDIPSPERRVTRSRSSSVENEHVDQLGGKPLSAAKASPIQGNVSGNGNNLPVKEVKTESSNNASTRSKTDKTPVSSPNEIVNSVISVPTSKISITKSRKNSNLELKEHGVNFSKSRKTSKGPGKITKNVPDRKNGEPKHEVIADDPGAGEVYEMIHDICKDIVSLGEFKEPLAASSAIDVPDSDFHNFDDDLTEYSFHEGEIWAIYDEEDGMPRIYARIQKVISHVPFSVQLAWLQSVTRTKLSCGQFKLGKGTTSNVLNLFSHKMSLEPSLLGDDIKIYPKKHEVWAVHDKRHSLDTDDASRYQIIEIHQEYTEHGISVISLIKVYSFKSIYQKVQIGLDPYIWSLSKKDLNKFSHQIPARKVVECAPGLPKDCYELDPAAIPNCLLKGTD